MQNEMGNKIKELRLKKGLTLEEVGKKVGVGKSTVRKWETGMIANMKRDKIALIAKALDTSPSYLMGWEDDGLNIKNILPLPKTKLIPVLGTIACGEPILAEENIETYFPADKNIKADFALKCKGDSMINARIFDGDIVYIRCQPDVEDGQIAAVLIGDEATLKKVRKVNNKLVLSPCNPLYDNLIYEGEELNKIKILGKAVAYTGLIK